MSMLTTAALSTWLDASAVEIDTGNPDLVVRFDNTIKYSVAGRTGARLAELSQTQLGSRGVVGPNNLNQDDGDNNFGRGLVSNRFDLLSEADVRWGAYGARVSGAGWYDSVYNTSNDNTTHSANVVPANEFASGTRDAMGRQAELLDAFIFGNGEVASRAAAWRAGRHTLLWGESLFFGSNGIAGGQAPIDVVKASLVPNSQFKEIALPTGKASGQVQVSDELTLGGYIGYEWEKSRLIPAGSYLSSADSFGPGAGFLYAGPLGTFQHSPDRDARNGGQGGLQLRWSQSSTETDFGLYAIRYNPTTPANIYSTLSGRPPALKASTYQWVYHNGTEAFGVSAAKSLGDWSLAGEVSVRSNAPLASAGQQIIPAIGAGVSFDNPDNPGYAVGRTGHAQFSWVASLPPSFIAREATFVGELAWNTVLSVQKNEQLLNPNTDKSAAATRCVFTPTYRQVLAGLDVSPSLGVSYGWNRSRAVGPLFAVNKGGDLNAGVSATYLNNWVVTLNYAVFYGPTGSALDNANNAQYMQSLKDRNYVSASVRTTF
jgi:Protein of unknown function (DUF1302)